MGGFSLCTPDLCDFFLWLSAGLINNTSWSLSAGSVTAGFVSAEPVWSEAWSSAAVPVRGKSGGRCILAGDRPRRRSLACSLHRGLGESALLCLFDARLVRAGGDGGGDLSLIHI